MRRFFLLDRLERAFRVSEEGQARGLSVAESLEVDRAERARALSRRTFLGGAAAAAGVLALGTRQALGAPKSSRSVGIVGAGLAGLTCAYELRRAGVVATLHEAADRVGGRCFSLGGAFPGPVAFPGQVVERGGELIDNLHKTMLGYAQEFGLETEDVNKMPGEVIYHFAGQRYPESAVVEEYRAFVAAMHEDLRACSGAPTADAHNDADVALDRTTLADYFSSRGASPLLRAMLSTMYAGEYGLAPEEQSALNFLLFIHADKRSKFRPWGVFSDERYHIVGGNQQVPRELAARLPGQIRLGERLVRVRKTSAGRIEVTFDRGGRAVSASYDEVVLTLPFSVLREVELDASLALPAWKRLAIDTFGYGTNAKMMVGFRGPFWGDLGGNGASYSDLPNHQVTWETNPSRATTEHAVLTDYSSGARGASLDPRQLQREAAAFLADLERVMPGAGAAALRTADGKVLCHLEPWPRVPTAKGSYTCYRPGQFTTLAGNEGKPIGNLHFAGEHTNSFYEWQGFMEGACLSGLQAASEVTAR